MGVTRSAPSRPGTAHVRVDDVALARRCAVGDRAAQRELFQRERRRVHGTLYRILGSNAEIDDLLQDAFIEIFRSIPSFRGEAMLGTWIDRITVRVAYAHLGKRRIDTLHLALVPEPRGDELAADERAMTRQAAAHLYAALDRVPAAQRIAFALHVVDGRLVKDVAQATNASVVATKVRIWRTWRALERAARRDPLLRDLLREPPERRPSSRP
jgi:RNA polymerase sigma-70 factor (ECF subfamily)